MGSKMVDDASNKFAPKTGLDVDNQDVDALSNQYLQEFRNSDSGLQYVQAPQDNQTFQHPLDNQHFQDTRDNQHDQENLSQAVWNAMIENRTGVSETAYPGHRMGFDPEAGEFTRRSGSTIPGYEGGSIMQGETQGSLGETGAAAEALIRNRQKADKLKQGSDKQAVQKDLNQQLTKENWWKEISPADIDQGDIGDCFFEASIASMANSEKGRKAIGNMVRQNDDGSIAVKFPGAADAISVSNEDLKKSTNRTPWAKAMEVAFLEYQKQHSLPFEKSGTRTFSDAATQRGVAELLTGSNNVTSDQFSFMDFGGGRLAFGATSIENVERDLIKALDSGNIITAGTNDNGAQKYFGGNAPGPVPGNHIYAVLDYDKSAKTVTVQNPWGQNSDSLGKNGDTIDGVTNLGSGKMEMPLEVFYDRFGGMTISGTNEAGTAVEHAVNTTKDAASAYTDAAVNLAKGDLAGAVKENVNGLKQVGYGTTQLGYAAGSAVWDAGDNIVDGVGNLAKKIF